MLVFGVKEAPYRYRDDNSDAFIATVYSENLLFVPVLRAPYMPVVGGAFYSRERT